MAFLNQSEHTDIHAPPQTPCAFSIICFTSMDIGEAASPPTLPYHIVSNSDQVLSFNPDIRGTANSVQAPMALTTILASIPKNHTSSKVFHIVLVLSPYWLWLFYWKLTSLTLPSIVVEPLSSLQSIYFMSSFLCVELASLQPKHSLQLAIQRDHGTIITFSSFFSLLPILQTPPLPFF